jgi:hypothetical protein
VGDGPIVLPEANDPRGASVGEEVQTGAGTIRAGDRETDLSDAADVRASSAGNRLGGVRFDAVGIHVFHETSRHR